MKTVKVRIHPVDTRLYDVSTHVPDGLPGVEMPIGLIVHYREIMADLHRLQAQLTPYDNKLHALDHPDYLEDLDTGEAT